MTISLNKPKLRVFQNIWVTLDFYRARFWNSFYKKSYDRLKIAYTHQIWTLLKLASVGIPIKSLFQFAILPFSALMLSKEWNWGKVLWVNFSDVVLPFLSFEFNYFEKFTPNCLQHLFNFTGALLLLCLLKFLLLMGCVTYMASVDDEGIPTPSNPRGYSLAYGNTRSRANIWGSKILQKITFWVCEFNIYLEKFNIWLLRIIA